MHPLIPVEPADRPGHYRLTVPKNLCVGPPDRLFMFGGVGLASALAAVEHFTGRPTVWAAAQYLSYARPGTELDLEVIVPVAGKYNSQARVITRAGDQEIITVNAALGSREGSPHHQWAQMPAVPPPEDCPEMTIRWQRDPDDMNSLWERRVAAGSFGRERGTAPASADGIGRLWVRPTDPGLPIDRLVLAVMADFLPSGVGNALGANAGGNSLDNTIRYMNFVPTGWVLTDIRIHAVHAGFAHGRVHLFAQDGTLLATASQSLIVRIHS
ncbi:acyl-CoA thioesterase [Sandarakinorhabdus sp.]|uniref:acyl-CoA thioesterase n=1 Tax=Sandarakinorhabdus sp. TaxID=1916663 RepID=UPI003564AA55